MLAWILCIMHNLEKIIRQDLTKGWTHPSFMIVFVPLFIGSVMRKVIHSDINYHMTLNTIFGVIVNHPFSDTNTKCTHDNTICCSLFNFLGIIDLQYITITLTNSVISFKFQSSMTTFLYQKILGWWIYQNFVSIIDIWMNWKQVWMTIVSNSFIKVALEKLP
jgi:hypothetical protein